MKLPMPRMLFDPMLLGAPFAQLKGVAHKALGYGLWGGGYMPDGLSPSWLEMSGGRAPLAVPTPIVVIVKSRRIAMTQFIGGGIAPALALSDWPHMPGEQTTFLYLGPDRTQSNIACGRTKGAFESSPLLGHEVANVTANRIELVNGNVLEIGTADSASVRGRTLMGAAIDEACFVSNLDELLRALRPALATTPGSVLILFSTPRGASGPVYEYFKRCFGVDDPEVCVIKAHVRQFNPTIPESFLQQQAALDPIGFASEWDCQFVEGLSAFLDAPLVDSCTRAEPREIPHRQHDGTGTLLHYVAALDASGGRSDATAAAVCHREGDLVIVDACRRWPSPHDPSKVAGEVAAFLASYGLRTAIADQYAAGFSRSVYAEAGVTLTDAPVSRSEAYLSLLPQLTSGRVELPPDPVLRLELLGLERRVARSGRDSVDHRPGAHDDVANSAALAVHALSRHSRELDLSLLEGFTSPYFSEMTAPPDGWQREFDLSINNWRR